MSEQNNNTSEATANPIRGRFNSWLLSKFENAFHKEVGHHKERFIKDMSGLVVEIGPGNGNNLRYYPEGVKLVAYEPNPHMHDRLNSAAKEHDVDLEIRAHSAEALDFEDNSVDFVVCTLVLCTVPNPELVLQEIRRILKPEGCFFFIEHVAAPEGSGLRKAQNLLEKPWRWLFEGCSTNRHTGDLLHKIGFSKVEMEEFQSKVMPPPILPQIAGIAVK